MTSQPKTGAPFSLQQTMIPTVTGLRWPTKPLALGLTVKFTEQPSLLLLLSLFSASVLPRHPHILEMRRLVRFL